MAIPIHGPREGYWGSRLAPKIGDRFCGWKEEPKKMLPFFHVEEDGWQHVGDVEDRDKFHLIIFGGSVAFGAYASDLQKTYFSVMVRELKKRGIPIYVTIMAVGGWWSTHEVAAWATEGVGLNPHAVMFLDGLTTSLTRKNSPWCLGVRCIFQIWVLQRCLQNGILPK